MRRYGMIVSDHYIVSNRGNVTNLVDNADNIHGMPVSLQLVGRRLEEESALMMAEVVLQTLG
jgi:Asp-tRNA(Asn)/Glu-tRNA(Gln) amidotransferase A subunit family amidase